MHTITIRITNFGTESKSFTNEIPGGVQLGNRTKFQQTTEIKRECDFKFTNK